MNLKAASLPALIIKQLALRVLQHSPWRGFQAYTLDLSSLLYFSGMQEVRYIEFPDAPMTLEESILALNELILAMRWTNALKMILLPPRLNELRNEIHRLENVVFLSAEDGKRIENSTSITQPLRELCRN